MSWFFWEWLKNPRTGWWVAAIALVTASFPLTSRLWLGAPKTSHRTKRRSQSKLEDVLSLDALVELTRSENVGLRKSALQIMLERMLKENNLEYLISSVKQSQVIKLRLKSIHILSLLAKQEPNRRRLLKHGALEAVLCIFQETTQDVYTERGEILTLAAMVTSDLLCNSENAKKVAVQSGILEHLKRFMKFNQINPGGIHEITYWSLVVFHQLTISVNLQQAIIDAQLLPILIEMTLHFQGNLHIQRLSLNSLVTFLTTLSGSDMAAPLLQSLLKPNLVNMITLCQRSDDTELVYWTVGLMHEFAIKEIGREELSKIENIVSVLGYLLSNNDATVQKVVLRTMTFLGQRNDAFHHEIIARGIVPRLLACLRSNNEEVIYWAILVVHDVCFYDQVQGHLLGPYLEVFLNISKDLRLVRCLCAADIIYSLCCSPFNHNIVLASTIMDSVRYFCSSNHAEMLRRAVTLLDCLVQTSAAMAQKVYDNEGVSLLESLILKDKSPEEIRLAAAKTLTLLAIQVPEAALHVQHTVIELIKLLSTQTVDCLAATQNSTELPMSAVFGSLDSLRALLCSGWITIDPALHNDQPSILITKGGRFVCRSLIDSKVTFGYVRTSSLNNHSSSMLTRALQNIELSEEHLKMIVHSLMTLLDLSRHNTSSSRDLSSSMISDWQIEAIVAITARVIHMLSKQTIPYQMFRKANVVSKLITRLQNICGSPLLASEHLHRCTAVTYILLALHSFTSKLTSAELFATPLLASVVMKLLHEFGSVAGINFHATAIIHRLFASDLTIKTVLPGVVCLSREMATTHVELSADGLTAHNASWTLETVASNVPAPVTGKWMFEVTIQTQSFMQIGWSSEAAVFDADGLVGVGDANDTYAIEDTRNKLGITRQPWDAGDVVGCLWDSDSRQLRYILNGNEILTSHTVLSWEDEDQMYPGPVVLFPAVSLNGNEQCEFNFGATPFKYTVDGYTGLQQLRPSPMPLEETILSITNNNSKSSIITLPNTKNFPAIYFEISFNECADADDWMELGMFSEKLYGIRLDFRSRKVLLLDPLSTSQIEWMNGNDGVLEAHVFGCGVFVSERAIFFTVDGEVKKIGMLPKQRRGLRPCVRGKARGIVNFGQSIFRFGTANRSDVKSEWNNYFVKFNSL